jgi:hypothetical protein
MRRKRKYAYVKLSIGEIYPCSNSQDISMLEKSVA